MAKTLLQTFGLAVVMLLTATAADAQTGTVAGTVVDEAGRGLPGATVRVEGTSIGTSTATDGSYTLDGIPTGTTTLLATFVGYEPETMQVRVGQGQTATANFTLAPINQALESIEVFANRAIDRKTPVAYTDIPKEQIQQQLGSRDIPMVLNTAPSVYATEQGGGAGDARINVRGFDQRNTAVMINGVPVNDMENGWVYWSNWDGVGDVTTSIQLQRGLAAVNLAVPSVGGTLNILTDPAQMDQGVSIKQEVGSGGFAKTSVSASTGLINDRLAFSAQGVRKTGTGVVDAAWTDAYSYYLSGSYQINGANTVALYAVGAPQRHGQRLYAQNLAVWDQDFARDVFSDEVLSFDEDNDGTADVFERYDEQGLSYNQNWGPVTPFYQGEQAVGNNVFDRYSSGFLNERENFYHKPQVNLNWYSQVSDRALLSTVVYYSGGKGGGTGTLGSLEWNYSGPSRIPNWDATIERNQSDEFDDNGNLARPAGQSAGILRNSRNNQWTIGGLTKLTVDVTDALVAEVGLDARTAEIEHYREVRDLLGGDYWLVENDEFNPNRRAGLGDKVDYDFTNTVDWLGGYAQAEIERGPVTAFAMGGLTGIKYTYENFFLQGDDGNTLTAESDNILGYQAKGGANYNLNDAVSIYANGGYISKVPIFDGVINDRAGAINPDPQNEKITSIELGANWRTRTAALKLSAYNTYWQDRTVTRGVRTESGDDGLVNLLGVNQLHRGVELEGSWKPLPELRLDAGVGLGDWYFSDDASGSYREEPTAEPTEFAFYLDDLKVGNQPQTSFSYAATFIPVDGVDLQLLGRTYANHYADFDPLDRTDADDREQSWRAPAYTVLDLNTAYDVPLPTPYGNLQVTLNVFNLLDAVYVQDATDNSSFNAFSANGVSHAADDAEVFVGLPRRYNLGLRFTY